ncbi:MAG: alanine--tRNA ligase, partial [Legionella sp. 21-45-4]
FDLGVEQNFMEELLPVIVDIYSGDFSEVAGSREKVIEILVKEEKLFRQTLRKGLRELTKLPKDKPIGGEAVFKLYDTYGFPVDLTADIAREHQLTVDDAGFMQCMQRQREQSQAASTFRTHDLSKSPALHQVSVFSGYTENRQSATVVALLSTSGESVSALLFGTKGGIVLDNTPFYAESGGQVGDRGQLTFAGRQGVFRVDDTQRVGQAIVHYGEVLKGECHAAQSVVAEIDKPRREAIRLNHTATHLLHAALKEILGSEVQQKGSLVDAARARFDFSYSKALTSEEVQHVEARVNAMIQQNVLVQTDLMSLEAAQRTGAVALFGEKYAEDVRVLSMGDFSKELCGGTHANRTGDLGLFKISAEYGVASGVRRIEMLTGSYALAWVNQQLHVLEHVASLLKTTSSDVVSQLELFVQDMKNTERALTDLKRASMQEQAKNLLTDVSQIQGINLLVHELRDENAQSLRSLLDELRGRLDNAVIVLIGIQRDKMQVVVGVNQALLSRGVPTAADLVRHLCGKGGGRADMAQGGGAVPADLAEKMLQIRRMLEENAKA